MATNVKDMVANAKEQIENLTPDEFSSELGRDDVLLVDLREPAEREQNGTIEGALSIPRGMLEFHADPSSPYHKAEFDPNTRVLLFCASGGRSALSGVALRELGYTDVAHLDGGFKAWSEQGQATTTS